MKECLISQGRRRKMEEFRAKLEELSKEGGVVDIEMEDEVQEEVDDDNDDEDEINGSVYSAYYDKLAKEEKKKSKKLHIPVPTQQEVILIFNFKEKLISLFLQKRLKKRF